MAGSIQTGSYTGTGAAQNIITGWVPDCVITFNATDGTVAGIWFFGMTNDTAIDLQGALAANAADGISGYEGSDGAGFKVGTDYSTNAKVYRYLAIKAG